MSENNVNGITGADVATTTGIIGATIGIGQYIVNDYVITIAATEGDYGYTMTITKGTETQTVTLYGLTQEQYDAMLGYLEAAQTAAQSSASSANTAATARNAAQSARDDAQSASETSIQAANAAITARNSALTYANNAQTAANTANSARSGADAARSAAVSAKTAAESAATRAETAAGQITGMTAEAETLTPGSPATASFLDGVLSLGIPAGATGATGADGNGIVSITKTGTQGSVDTYTITYTNGTTSMFTVTNGVDGAVLSVAGKTGAVTLDAGDVEYDDTDTYSAGSVGAGLADLKSQIKATIDNVTIDNWANGSIDNSGNNSSVNGRIRTEEKVSSADGYIGIFANEGYQFFVAAYNKNGTFAGTYRDNGTIGNTGNLAYVSRFPLATFSQYDVRIVMRRTDSTNITLAEKTNAIFEKTKESTLEGEVARIEADIDNLRDELLDDDAELLTPQISSSSNPAATDNGDGTITIGTTDYGSVFFDSPLTLVPGEYTLFGVPNTNGFSFVATTESSTTAIAKNDSSDSFKFTIETKGQYYVGFRNTVRPSASYVISPSLKHNGVVTAMRTELDDSEFIGQTDVITSYISKTNNQVTNNGDGTYTIGTGDYGTVIFEELTLYPGLYKLFGTSDGYSFISTGKVVSSAFVINKTGKEKLVAISEKTLAFLGFRNDRGPSSSFIITPYLIVDRNAETNLRIDALEGTIKPYYSEEMADTIAKVRSVNDEPALVFPWVTDIHRYTANIQTFQDMIANMKAFAKQVKCDFVLNTGDTIEGDASQDTSLGYAYDSIGSFKDIGEPFFYVEGNHDNNPYISSGALVFTLKQVFGGFFAASKGMTFNANENGTDYYFDFANLGVRFISVNSCNSSINTTYGFGNSTAAWLSDALDTDHVVILASHVSPISDHVWSNNSPANVTGIRNALASFVTGGGKLIVLTGHSHVDAEFVNPYVEITDVCQKFEKADTSTSGYTGMSGQIDGLKNPDRTDLTYTADAWTVCIYKPISNELDLIRFGAGIDRYIHCEPVGVGTVTTRFTSTVTWHTSNNSVATVSDGTITVVGSGRCAIYAKDDDGNIEVWIVDA